MSQLKVTQLKSGIGTTPVQRRTLKALGLNKVGKVRVHNDSLVVKGMINVVNHLVAVEKV